jgi:hypothetical protein
MLTSGTAETMSFSIYLFRAISVKKGGAAVCTDCNDYSSRHDIN